MKTIAEITTTTKLTSTIIIKTIIKKGNDKKAKNNKRIYALRVSDKWKILVIRRRCVALGGFFCLFVFLYVQKVCVDGFVSVTWTSLKWFRANFTVWQFSCFV